MTGPTAPRETPAAELHPRARGLLARGYRLATVAGHDDGGTLRVVYVFLNGPASERVELVVRLDAMHPEVPTLSDLSFPASRFERELHDLFGIVPVGHAFLRPLVLHQHWPARWHPMRRGAGPMPPVASDPAPYPFIEVAGAGVYEIPVGPVHAGLIEPGHFRFSVVGETILKMTARLWYLHRGVERLFEGKGLADAGALAERISGDTAVGHALAFSAAVEDALGIEVDVDTQLRRCVLVELERLYNHVGDLGAMCNDVAFGIANARAQIIRERLLRLNEQVTGHRLLRGAITPGGTHLRRLPGDFELAAVKDGVDEIVDLALSNSVVVDRFEGTAVLSYADAVAIGTLGVTARASGVPIDARTGVPGTDQLPIPAACTQQRGDVLARFNQRVCEVEGSLALLAMCTSRLGPDTSGTGARTLPDGMRGGARGGLGIVEGWRGLITHRVELDSDLRVTRCKVVDPSFFNWPALAVSLSDTIVPDFPLVNKSFNLSYAGNDL